MSAVRVLAGTLLRLKFCPSECALHAQGLLALLQIDTGVEALTEYEAAATFLTVLVLTAAEKQSEDPRHD